jgi:uncharacterized protein YdeI (YjbR/CyaY-like superfamily)
VTAAPARGARAAGPAGARPRFFASASAFRDWLAKHHARETELLVGFHRVAAGRNTLTYPQALDEALCFGWIDGLRRRIGDDAYSIRFSPRKPGSTWSQVNLGHVARLEREGRLTAAGRTVFEARDPARTYRYSFEVRRYSLAAGFARRLAADPKARAHYGAMPPSYHHAVTHWIMSAKREATRERRFATLLDCSRRGVRVPPLDLPKPAANAAVPSRTPVAGRRTAARRKPAPRKA